MTLQVYTQKLTSNYIVLNTLQTEKKQLNYVLLVCMASHMCGVVWCDVRAGVNEYLAPCQALHQSLSEKACPWLKFILLISLILLDKWVGATLGA